jgi:WD40 repeat protein
VRALAGHKAAVWSVAFAPKGNVLASGDRDGSVRLWDTAEGRTTHTAQAAGPVTALAFSAGGEEVACGTSSASVLLWAPANDRRLKLAHGRWVNAVRFRDGESALAVASFDGAVTLWDTPTGRRRPLPDPGDPFAPPAEPAVTPDGKVQADPFGNTINVLDPSVTRIRHKLEGHRHRVSVVALSADGRRLASGSDDGTIRLWDPATGRELGELRGHTLGVRALSFAPDGKLLASGACDASVRLWDVDAGQERATCRGHTSTVAYLAFSGDGTALASSGPDRTVCLWDVAAHKLRRRLEGVAGKAPFGPPRDAEVAGLALSRDGGLLALIADHFILKLVDAATGAERGSAREVSGPLCFSPDGKLLVSGGGNPGGRVWTTDPLKVAIPLGPGYLRSVAILPDGKTLATVDFNGNAARWDLATGKGYTLWAHQSEILALAVSPDGKALAAAGGYENTAGELKVWDLATAAPRFAPDMGKQPVTCLAYSPDGKTLAAGGHDGSVRLWDVATGKELPGPPKVIGGINALAFTPDGKTLAVGRRWFSEADRSWALRDVQLWDVEKGKERARLTGHETGVTRLAISPDGKRLASASFSGEIKLWDLDTAKELRTLAGHKAIVWGLAFSPDGATLASASGEPKPNPGVTAGVVKLWDADTGEERLSLKMEDAIATAVAFTPDGKTVLATDWRGQLRGWDARDGKPRLSGFVALGAANRALLFTPDGKQLITAGGDRKIRFWDVSRLGSDFPLSARP